MDELMRYARGGGCWRCGAKAGPSFEEWDELKMYLPIGLNFNPTDKELLQILINKNQGLPICNGLVNSFNLYQFDPHAFPPDLVYPRDDGKMYIFTPLRKHANTHSRAHRMTPNGFWKMTGSSKQLRSTNGQKFGKKTSLAYYTKDGCLNGKKTSWLMQEYQLVEHPQNTQDPRILHEVVLCVVYKCKRGQKNNKCVDDDDVSVSDVERGAVAAAESSHGYYSTNSSCGSPSSSLSTLPSTNYMDHIGEPFCPVKLQSTSCLNPTPTMNHLGETSCPVQLESTSCLNPTPTMNHLGETSYPIQLETSCLNPTSSTPTVNQLGENSCPIQLETYGLNPTSTTFTVNHLGQTSFLNPATSSTFLNPTSSTYPFHISEFPTNQTPYPFIRNPPPLSSPNMFIDRSLLDPNIGIPLDQSYQGSPLSSKTTRSVLSRSIVIQKSYKSQHSRNTNF